MFHRLRDRPRLLETAYRASRRLLELLRPWMKGGGWLERLLIPLERATKGPLFNCRMCGQCVLHYTGMTCPMTCPKNLRNGPCGGVRANGNCEIIPEMRCIWVEAWERSKAMGIYGGEILKVLPPHDRRLEGSSAWVNDFTGRAHELPIPWAG